MAYTDNKAPGRAPVTELITNDIASNKIQPVATAERVDNTKFAGKVTPPIGVSGKFNEGYLVQFKTNDKGTGRLGVPTAVGIANKDKFFSPVENPDGKDNRPGAQR